jgi:hypothetical protein
MTVEERSTDHPEIRQNRRSEVPPEELHPNDMGSLGEQHWNGSYVEKAAAAGQGLELLAGKPGRQNAHALERMPQGESRHGNSVQSIPHSGERGAGDAGMADLILRVGYHVVEIHHELAPA